jgi:hypothetical protein
MLPNIKDRYEAWLRAPPVSDSSDPHIEFRVAAESEFERIFDLIDEAFGVRRPRALFHWAYRRNPLGPARCWVGVEKRSGRFVCSGSHFPWPVVREGEVLCGFQGGDAAVALDFQRRGLTELRRRTQTRHPVHHTETRVMWPNEISLQRERKYGRHDELLGAFGEGVFQLEDSARRWLRPLAAATRRLAGAARRGERAATRGGPIVQEVTRFDSGFDAATERCMTWNGFWSPHDAEFLNWRYLDRPVGSHRALAVLEGDEVAGYCVVRGDGRTAVLMEFAAPQAGAVPLLLLRSAMETAREAGCRRLSFFAPPGWRHWPIFRTAGLADRRSPRILSVVPSSLYGAGRLEEWQLVPGDSDAS